MAHTQTEDVKIPAADGREIDAALALPSSASGSTPAVLVLHEIFGLNDDIRRIAATFAHAGYVALAPDLFGAGFRPACIVRAIAELRRREGRTFGDLDAARKWLTDRPEVDGSKIGVAGFCMGGGFALAYGIESDVDAAATFYGEVPPQADDLTGVCPIVAGYGERDMLFAKQGRRLETFLTDHAVDHDVRIYPNVGHSFMNQHPAGLVARMGAMSPMRVGYDEDAASDSWSRMLAFFDRHLERGQ
jgi:carboxymethylenebutenolidase